jgi:hypothetical protein
MDERALKTLIDESKPDKHNWLYSFMMAQDGIRDNTNIYLVAYCKQCDNGLSVRVPKETNYSVRIRRMHIPKTGCIPV